MSLILSTTDSSGQSAYSIFDRWHQNVNIATTFSKLHNSGELDVFELPTSSGLRLGYNYIYSLNNFYGVGIGAQAGYIKYVIQLETQASLENSGNIMTLNIPVFINKYYPFNNEIALHFKTGININILFSSLANMGEKSGESTFYTTNISYKKYPQPGILFELGLAYRIVNKNFVTINFMANKNFLHAIDIEYEYESEEEEVSMGSLYGTGSYAGIAISYNFFSLINK